MARRPLWIAIDKGFLCDPQPEAGELVLRAEVLYWRDSHGTDWLLDLTDEALAEARRRNEMRPSCPASS